MTTRRGLFGLLAGGAAMAAGVPAVVRAAVSGGYEYRATQIINPLTQLHASEMILPARLAKPMRDMLAEHRETIVMSSGYLRFH